MQVVVAGGSGFIGRALCRALLARGHAVTVLTRQPQLTDAPPGLQVVRWRGADELKGRDDRDAGALSWLAALEGAQVVFNLSGESVAKARWTPGRKALLKASREGATRALIAGISQVAVPPGRLINASAVGYYGPRGDEVLTEASPPGSGFLPELCRGWEAAARTAEALGVKVTIARIGVVLDQGGGALGRMLPSFRLGLGGRFGDGRQWISWIHRQDVVELLVALMDRDVQGPVNLVAPEPVRNQGFTEALGRALHRPAVLPVPALALRLALGELAHELLLTGQRVLPTRCQELELPFRYPTLAPALAQILDHHPG